MPHGDCVLEENHGEVAWKLNTDTSGSVIIDTTEGKTMVIDVPQQVKERQLVAVRTCEIWALDPTGQDGEVFVGSYQETRCLNAAEQESVKQAVDTNALSLSAVKAMMN